MDGRVTEIIGIPGFPNSQNSSYGNDKDKAIDMKYQLLRETKYLPAFSLGIMDPTGNEELSFAVSCCQQADSTLLISR